MWWKKSSLRHILYVNPIRFLATVNHCSYGYEHTYTFSRSSPRFYFCDLCLSMKHPLVSTMNCFDLNCHVPWARKTSVVWRREGRRGWDHRGSSDPCLVCNWRSGECVLELDCLGSGPDCLVTEWCSTSSFILCLSLFLSFLKMYLFVLERARTSSW